VAVDRAQLLFDERVRQTPVDERRRIHDEMRRDAFRLAWAQADRAGPMTPLELTRFLLERLYPDLRGARLDRIMEQFAELEREGRWSGPVRPSD
jgi:hypothetical protein